MTLAATAVSNHAHLNASAARQPGGQSSGGRRGLVVDTTPRVRFDWPQHGIDATRVSVNSAETVLTPSSVPRMKSKWTLKIDGATVGSPVVLTAVPVGRTLVDLVYIATESGVVHAANAGNGKALWRRSLGFFANPNCFDLPNNRFGAGGTPVAARALGVLFVAAMGRVQALNLSTGASAPGWPLQSVYNPTCNTTTGA